jgi:cobalamin biosynthesis Mg chelatase CobN
LGRSAGTMFGKMPHWYKGVGGAANGLNPEQLAGVSGASMRRMISSLEEATSKGDTKAGENLAALARTWGEAIKNPNTVNRIDKTAMSGMGQFLERMSKPDNNIRAKIVGSIEDANLKVDTSKVLDVLTQRITPNGDVRDPEPTSQQVQQQETTTQTGAASSQNTGAAGGGATQQQTGGTPSGGGATGEGAGGGTYTPAQPPQEFNYERNAQAIAQALKESDAFKIPHSSQTQQPHAPGEVIIPTRGETDSGILIPQERRTRPGSDNQ